MHGNRTRRAVRTIAAVALALAMACGTSGCKPTDFFTEVVISPYADKVDENNPNKAVVNNPDAQDESGELTALDWTDQSKQSESVENLVVYSRNPNTVLTTHHSVYSLTPQFPGIEASDGVRLQFDASAALDHSVDASSQDQSVQATSTGAGGQSADDAQTAASDQAANQQVQSNDASTASTDSTSGRQGDQQGGSANGDASSTGSGGSSSGGNTSDQKNTGTGDTTDPSKSGGGTTDDPYAGYGGKVKEYDPGNAFEQVQRVNHLAVLGSDAAVLAQSLGGAGAVCAMSDYAYRGLDSSGARTSTYSYFGEVFANESSSIKRLWSNDGSSPSDLSDISALVAACGQNGLIVYDQRLGDQTTLFTDEQRKELYAAGIELAPVDMSTVQGMLDAARVIGDALSQSTECAQNAKTMSNTYIDTVNGIVKAVAATHGDALASPGRGGGYNLLTTYNGCPVTQAKASTADCFIATEAESGLSYTLGNVDASGIVLFERNNDTADTPLYFWQQAAGLHVGSNPASSTSAQGLTPIWPLSAGITSSTLVGGSSGGAHTRWLGQSADDLSAKGFSWGQSIECGLGSARVPYLIVCSSSGSSASSVKAATVNSMASRAAGGALTPYSVLNFNSFKDDPAAFANLVPADPATQISSTIGEDENGSRNTKSPFYNGLALNDVVRQNPEGLLGSWTEGSMESVLESVWLADLYSKSPSGCSYSPVTDMSKFSVAIGGTTCTTTRDAVLAFYKTFYRCDASGAYGGIVTDQGL